MSSFQSSSSLNTKVVKKLTALIIDDDIVVRMVPKELLRKFGVETHEAKNDQEAVHAHHNCACFDMIMMDLDMPVMNSRQATKELRDMHVDSLIVEMTSRKKEEEEKSFMDVGLDYYYQKPLTIDVVRDLVEKIKENA
ncbi:two-component response regulator ARR22-like [Solanum tuberosum]|uniref:Sensory transduction histidine kinase bacterial n=1 Tax=Solanum tuberosum TaxID=4113 RepID=M1DQT6_SOLTU|nr:PREDICTED: two-component response regulator ARR22-like [Solanum tuberosum]KAH0689162.1 hypothetical protein KY289_016520 [Solanum tuberosum]